MRLRRSSMAACGTLTLNGRMASDSAGACADWGKVLVMVLSFGMTAARAAPASTRPQTPPTVMRNVCDVIGHSSWKGGTSPFATRRRNSFQDGAHDEDPHEADDREDQPRIESVRCPEPAAHPRRAARHTEQDRADPGPEQSVGDHAGPPQPERS